MKKIMEDLKKDIAPFVEKTFKTGRSLLSSVLNKLDYDLTTMINMLKEKQKNLKEYLLNREVLLKQIDSKHQEVDRLKEQISKVKNNSNTKQLDELRNDLNIKLDELICSQRRYFDLEEKIKLEEQKASNLLQEKIKVESDRNKIKSKYEALQSKLKENKNKTVLLEKQIQELTKKELQLQEQIGSADSKIKIKELEESLIDLQKIHTDKMEKQKQLQNEIDIYQKEYKQLENQLIQKVSEFSKISNKLHLVNMTLTKVSEEKDSIKVSLETAEKSLVESTQKINKLELEVKRLKILEQQYEEEFNIVQEEIQEVQKKIAVSQEEAVNEMIAYEERIDDLHRELIDKQNEVALAKAENGKAYELSTQEKEILEREFEPRFNVLYKECKFYPEFYSDFFRVTPSDRLKIEASIVQLNYNFDQYMTNVRPNVIRTKNNTILEYPFGTDAKGRIYFKKQNHTIHLYRISRTANGKGKLTQDNVIEWLKTYK
jgi:chromosome segregation ATPase